MVKVSGLGLILKHRNFPLSVDQDSGFQMKLAIFCGGDFDLGIICIGGMGLLKAWSPSTWVWTHVKRACVPFESCISWRKRLKRWAIKDFQRTNRYQSSECSFKQHLLLGGGFKYVLFSPRSLGKWSNLTYTYFSNGLVQPPTSLYFCIISSYSLPFCKKLRPPRRTQLGLGFFGDEPNGRDGAKTPAGSQNWNLQWILEFWQGT